MRARRGWILAGPPGNAGICYKSMLSSFQSDVLFEWTLRLLPVLLPADKASRWNDFIIFINIKILSMNCICVPGTVPQSCASEWLYENQFSSLLTVRGFTGYCMWVTFYNSSLFSCPDRILEEWHLIRCPMVHSPDRIPGERSFF